MHILAIDATAVVASAAVCRIEEGKILDYSLFSLKNGLKHSERLLPIIDTALEMYGIKIPQVDLIAVSVGPGSFTGVRIGVATVKGLVFANNIPVAPVSTLQALAHNCGAGIACPVMDARRGQFYNALFQDGRRLTADRCISGEELYAELKGLGRAVICGDGAALFASMYDDLTLASPAATDQNALSVAICGYNIHINKQTVSGEELKPVYLRPSQAEREKLRKEENQ